jgi:hypothetical protein
MSYKKMTVLSVILLAAVVVIAFSITDDEYERAVKAGYDIGHSDYKSNVRSAKGIENLGKATAINYYGRGKDEDSSQKKRAFLSGFKQGWDDKANGRSNRYFDTN